MLYHTHLFQCSNIKKKPQPQKPQKQRSCPANWQLNWHIFSAERPYSYLASTILSACEEKKKSKSRCSCLAGLWDCFVSVMQWPKFSSVVLIQPAWGRSGSGYTFGLLCLVPVVSCRVPHPERECVEKCYRLFSPAQSALLLGSSLFYLNSPVGLTVFQLLASLLLLYITIHPKFVKYPMFIFTFL